MERQRILHREEEPTVLWAVIDEAALRRPIGSREVMAGQFQHLIEIAAKPNITLQIVTFRAGAHAAEAGAFSLLRFPNEDVPDVVYLEMLPTGMTSDKPEWVDMYRLTMEKLSVQAETPGATVAFLEELLKTI
ncbi:DUF5753 domain-containing protein [Allostreptomyces psammosilenae]|uniref:DUF5753 domain-containing protein n=1 Tax=Allostreptomyces psammosilenae TaxID=1892865 RepID=A0A852ZZ06_9ACTN|nr:hypothetical protein [Allostreptomyces psammosilenae]